MTDPQVEFTNFIQHHVMNHGTFKSAWELSFINDFIQSALHCDSVVIFVVCAVLVLLACIARRQLLRIPHGLGLAMEEYVKFIRDGIVYPNFGGAELGRRFVPFFCSIFLFILLANLLGLIPLFSAATGNLNVTAAMALVFFSVSLFETFFHGGFLGLKDAFLPGGLPMVLRPLMIFMEVLSFCSRTFALALRLFANMMGGHIVLYAILALTMTIGAYVTALSFPMGVILYLFEVFVSVLQAYVFTLLSAIFMGMMVHPQH